MGNLNHQTKFRIKLWSSRILFVAAFFSIPLMPHSISYFWLLFLVLPGAALMLFLWPSVLANKELAPAELKTARLASIGVLVLIVGVCAGLNLYGWPTK